MRKEHPTHYGREVIITFYNLALTTYFILLTTYFILYHIRKRTYKKEN